MHSFLSRHDDPQALPAVQQVEGFVDLRELPLVRDVLGHFERSVHVLLHQLGHILT